LNFKFVRCRVRLGYWQSFPCLFGDKRVSQENLPNNEED